MLKDEAKAAQHAETALQLRADLQVQAEKLRVEPSLQADFEALKKMHPECIAERGGFEALLARLGQDAFTEADRFALLAQIAETRQQQRRERQQDRDQGRGGRGY